MQITAITIKFNEFNENISMNLMIKILMNLMKKMMEIYAKMLFVMISVHLYQIKSLDLQVERLLLRQDP